MQAQLKSDELIGIAWAFLPGNFSRTEAGCCLLVIRCLLAFSQHNRLARFSRWFLCWFRWRIFADVSNIWKRAGEFLEGELHRHLLEGTDLLVKMNWNCSLNFPQSAGDSWRKTKYVPLPTRSFLQHKPVQNSIISSYY